ncbi:MAG: hypothetical protein IKP27_12225 [Paludibacteraceae bacterium]|nr:hypothetical protein [Paludibacteraceae bacterium]
MKKIFNLAVIFAALTAAFTFASCGDDDDKADENSTFTSMQVSAGEKYSFSNKQNAVSGWIKVTAASAGSVTFELTCDGTDQKDEEITLSDAGTSYLILNEGKLVTSYQDNAVANANAVIIALMKGTQKLGDGNVNTPIKSTGKAGETLFGKK